MYELRIWYAAPFEPVARVGHMRKGGAGWMHEPPRRLYRTGVAAMTAISKVLCRASIARVAWISRPALVVLLASVACLAAAASAGAETATYSTYSAVQSVPVPPASSFHGNGGGDGWAVALSETR